MLDHSKYWIELDVAYRLALPSALERMHNVFHVSQLRKYVPDPDHSLLWTIANTTRYVIHGRANTNPRSQGETIKKQKYSFGKGFMEESKYRRSNLGTGRGDTEGLSTFVPRFVKFRGRNLYKDGRM